MEHSGDVDEAVVQAIDAYVKQLHPGFVPTQSHMSRTLWRFLDRNSLASEHIEAKVMEFLRKGILTKRQTINGQGQELVTTELNLSHQLVIKALMDASSLANEDAADVFAAEAIDLTSVDEDGVASARYQRRFAATSGARRGRQGYTS